MSTRAVLVGSLITCAAFAPAARGASASALYEGAAPSVVVVTSYDPETKEASIGTGSLISGLGHILTNLHVISPGSRGVADLVTTYLKPANTTGSPVKDLQIPLESVVVAVDVEKDLALLKVRLPDDVLLPPLPISLEIGAPGDPTVAIGHPEDGGLWTLTTGALSNSLKDFGDVVGNHVYQMETPINPGNSGGPLLNAKGELIGVTTSAVKIGKGGLPTANIQFAVSNVTILDFLKRALRGQVPGGKALAQVVAGRGKAPCEAAAEGRCMYGKVKLPKSGGVRTAKQGRAGARVRVSGEGDHGDGAKSYYVGNSDFGTNESHRSQLDEVMAEDDANFAPPPDDTGDGETVDQSAAYRPRQAPGEIGGRVASSGQRYKRDDVLRYVAATSSAYLGFDKGKGKKAQREQVKSRYLQGDRAAAAAEKAPETSRVCCDSGDKSLCLVRKAQPLGERCACTNGKSGRVCPAFRAGP